MRHFPNQLLLPSLIGDALALGPHWVYEPETIAGKIANFDHYHPPITAYHPGKLAGDQTHYGDQTLLLFHTLRRDKTWNAASFKDRWIGYWEASKSYKDKATKATLENGKGSDYDDLGGPARLAPLLDFFADKPLPEQIAAAREETALTHANPLATDAAEFITRVAFLLREDAGFTQAFHQAAQEGAYVELPIRDMLDKAKGLQNKEAIAAIDELGQACPVPQSLPSTLWLGLHYANDPVNGLMANVKAGGDSAARGMVLGLWMGAKYGHPWIPKFWKEELHAKTE